MFPTLTLQNEYGEQTSNFIKDGQLNCNFVVDSANGNGLGLRSLKGNGIAAAYMHTSATPLGGNPNPAAGLILVKLALPYLGYISGNGGFVSPVTGSPSTSTVAGAPSIIAALGTATLLQWQAAGLPVGQVPAVGLAFIPTVSGVIGGSASVIGPGASGVDSIEVVGNANLSVIAAGGGYVLVQCLLGGVLTAPADGTVVGLNFQMAGSVQEA